MKSINKKRVLDFEQFLAESTYREVNSDFLIDKFTGVPNDRTVYSPTEADFESLPWYQAIKRAFPGFKLAAVKKSRAAGPVGYRWIFSAEDPSWKKNFEVYRTGEREEFNRDGSRLTYNGDYIYGLQLNTLKEWNRLFMGIYFLLFGDSRNPGMRTLQHITNLISSDLEGLYDHGDLGVVGVKKNCEPYGGHYKSKAEMLRNLPYGIFDDIKARFIKKIEEDPAVIQYAISQCQLPDSTSQKNPKWGNGRYYPKGEVLEFYNLLKKEGYVPPAGFDEETGGISDLHKSLDDIGL